MPAINVARTDTFEVQRQKINEIGANLFQISQGGSDLSTGNLKLGDGTSTTPSLSFISDSSLGLYKPSVSTLGIVNNSKNIVDMDTSSIYSYKDLLFRQKKIYNDGISLNNQGSGYDAGDYVDIPLIGGSGTGATANFTVSAFIGVTNSSGSGYNDGSFNNVDLIGGSGSGVKINFTVDTLQGDITNAGSGYVPGFYENVPLVTITGSGSGGLGTFNISGSTNYSGSITSPGSNYSQGIYNNIELLNTPVQTFAVTAISNPGTPPPAEVFQIDGNTQQALTLVAGNTYRFDLSDSSVASHPFAFSDQGGNPLNPDNYQIVYKGTAGSAGAFVDLIIKPGSSGQTINYYCVSHSGMGSTITVTSGSTSSYGHGLTATITVDVNGNIIQLSNLNNPSGGGYTANNILSVYPGDIGGTGSGFQYTINAPVYTGEISNVSITNNGVGYVNGDTLTVNNSNIGGNGSGFIFTVTSNPGIISDIDFSDFGSGYIVGDTLSLSTSVNNVSTYFQDLIENISTTLSSASPQITVADTTGIFPGMVVFGSNGDTGTLQAETSVLSVDSPTQITLNKNPATSGAAILSFNPSNFSSIYLPSTSGILPGYVVTKVSGTGNILDNVTVLTVDNSNYLTLSTQPQSSGDVVLNFTPPYGDGTIPFEFEIQSLGNITDFVISSGGNGYNVGDTLSVNSNELVQPISYSVKVKNLQKITFNSPISAGVFSTGSTVTKRDGAVQSILLDSSSTILGEAGNVYSNVSATTSGNGQFVLLSVERDLDGNISDFSVTSPGYFYSQGDTLTVSGADVGGSSPADDLSFSITAVSEEVSNEIIFVKESEGNTVYILTENSSFEVNDIVYDNSLNLYTIQSSADTIRFTIDTGSGDILTPNITLYEGSTYSFDLSDASNNNHLFSFSEFKDGTWSPSLVENVSTTLNLGVPQITVADTSNIIAGMNVVDVDPENYEGNLVENTKVLSVDGPTTLTLTKTPISAGAALLNFSGYEYTDGVTRSSSELVISVSDTTPTTLYYFDNNQSSQSNQNSAGEDFEEAYITIDPNNPKTFGSGFSSTVLDLESTDIITSNIETGLFTSASIETDSLTSPVATVENLNFTNIEGTKVTVSQIVSNSDLSISASTNLNLSANLNIGNSIQILSSNGNINTLGELKTTDRLNINDKLFITNNIISTASGNNLVLKPPTGQSTIVDSTTAIAIPSGTTNQRPSSALNGHIRFNTQTNQYEGYSAATQTWSSLGGVRDLDGNTTILAEESVGSNDNTLWFINDNVNTIRVTPEYQEFVNVKKIRSVNTSAPDYINWEANNPVTVGQYLKYRNNIFEVVVSGTTASSGNEPLNTTGNSFINGTSTLRFFTSAVSQLTFEEISQLNIDPLGFTDLVINGELRFSNNVISTDNIDLVFSPKAGQKVKISSPTSLVIPVGDDNSKGNPEQGSIRYNTTIDQYEGFNGSTWSSLGGVRDVDGNTYIIPETSPGSNENILYFYNNNSNTLRVSETQIEFDAIDTIVSDTSNTLNINASTITFDNLATTLDNTSTTETFLFSTKNNLDLGLSSGLNTDHLLRLTNTGNIVFNLGFGTGTDDNVTLLNSTLTSYNLKDVKISTSKILLERGTNNSGNANVYNTSTEASSKLFVTAHNITTGDKELIEFLVTHDGTDVFFTDTSNIKTGEELISTVFDISPSGNVRITVVSNSNLTVGDEIEITIVNTTTKR